MSEGTGKVRSMIEGVTVGDTEEYVDVDSVTDKSPVPGKQSIHV
jgi:hypothetical protein